MILENRSKWMGAIFKVSILLICFISLIGCKDKTEQIAPDNKVHETSSAMDWEWQFQSDLKQSFLINGTDDILSSMETME